MLKYFRMPVISGYTAESLQAMPVGSLGHNLFCFLQERGLPFLPHYARHDLKHVLLQYDTTDEGEACLQCFMLGNGRVSFPVLATVIYAILTMPEHWKKMRVALRQGRLSTSFHHWQWNELLTVPVDELRKRIFTYQNVQI